MPCRQVRQRRLQPRVKQRTPRRQTTGLDLMSAHRHVSHLQTGQTVHGLKRWRVAVLDENAISLDRAFIIWRGAGEVFLESGFQQEVSPESLDVGMYILMSSIKWRIVLVKRFVVAVIDKLLTVCRRSHIICAALMA